MSHLSQDMHHKPQNKNQQYNTQGIKQTAIIRRSIITTMPWLVPPYNKDKNRGFKFPTNLVPNCTKPHPFAAGILT